MEHDLGLDAGMDQLVEPHRLVGVEQAGRQQLAEARRVDVHRDLLRPRGQPELRPDHQRTIVALPGDDLVLHRVRLVDREATRRTERLQLATLSLGGDQLVDRAHTGTLPSVASSAAIAMIWSS